MVTINEIASNNFGGYDYTPKFISNCIKQSNSSFQEYVRQSRGAYQLRDYSEYQRLMMKVVKLEPQNYRYRYNLNCAHALNADVQNTTKIEMELKV